MKSLLFVIRKRPGPEANETIEAAMTCAVFGQDIKMLFLDDGVWQLMENLSIPGQKSTTALISALPDYEVNSIFVDRDSLKQRGIDSKTLPEFVSVVDQSQVHRCLHTPCPVISD